MSPTDHPALLSTQLVAVLEDGRARAGRRRRAIRWPLELDPLPAASDDEARAFPHHLEQRRSLGPDAAVLDRDAWVADSERVRHISARAAEDDVAVLNR